MNNRTRGWLWIAGALVVVVFLVAGGGKMIWGALLAMHGVH